MELFDTHFHLSGNIADDDIIINAAANDVNYLLATGGNYEESVKSQEFASKHDNTWFTVGVHPHEAENYNTGITKFNKFLNDDKLVAIGEIGLDYFYENSPRKIQCDLFDKFVHFAADANLPIVIHCRDRENSQTAYKDAWRIIADFIADGRKVVYHCFTGSPEWTEKLLAAGVYLGITGIVTFPKAENVRDILRMIPDNQLLLETDSPYLAPKPHRGKPNQPAFLRHTAEKVAEVRNCSLEELAKITTANAFRLFDLKNFI